MMKDREKEYWRGEYSLDDIIKYCNESGLSRKDIKVVCSVYDIDSNGDNKGCQMSEVKNFRLCITDNFLELMIRKDDLQNADNYFKTKVVCIDTGKRLEYKGRGIDCYCTTPFEYFEEGLYLTRVVNPEKLEQVKWYEKNGIEGDIFHIVIGGKKYNNCTWANNTIVRVVKR